MIRVDPCWLNIPDGRWCRVRCVCGRSAMAPEGIVDTRLSRCSEDALDHVEPPAARQIADSQCPRRDCKAGQS